VTKLLQKQEGKGSDTLIINYSGKNRKGNYLKYGKINLAQGTIRNKSKEPTFNRKSDVQRFEVSPRETGRENISERKSYQHMPKENLFMIEKHISEGNPSSKQVSPSHFGAKQPSKQPRAPESRLNSSG